MLKASSSSAKLSVGIVLFPNVTQLDVTGPYEVFARMPATVHLVAATLEPIRSEQGLTILPELTFETAPQLDVICVPGGIGVNAAMEDQALLAFLQCQASGARYITSVCTGALVLGAAGLLRGYQATTHWLSLELLPLFGAHPVDQRVVIDRNRITGGGVTAGIDFGLVIASELCDAAVAQEIQLMIEYDPVPPHPAGSRSSAPAAVVQGVLQKRQQVQSDRRIVAERAAARLDHMTDGPNGKSAQGLVAAQQVSRNSKCNRDRNMLTLEREVDRPQLLSDGRVFCPPTWRLTTLEGFALKAAEAEGVAIDSLEPGTTLVVHTRNSQYRLVILFDPAIVLVKGGAMFPEATVVRLEGATAGGSALKIGWILVGFRMEMWVGSVRIRSSRVRSISIEEVPPLRAWATH